MAGRSPTDDIDLAPSDAPARADYDRDVYSWSREQARLVREGRWDLVDRENVAEEIESLGRTEFAKLESALRVLLVHMLKWDHQPNRRTRSWALSMETQRYRLDDVMTDNPGLRPRLGEAVERAYRQARLGAIKQTGFRDEVFAHTCPSSWDEITRRPFDLKDAG